MNYNTNIPIQHESYRPSKFKKYFKGAKRIGFVAFFISLILIVAGFAENNTLAFASAVEDTSDLTYQPVEKTLEEIKNDYFTGIINDVEIAGYAIKYSEEFGIDTSLIVALMKMESNFNPLAINYNTNSSIDRGLCQLNNKTFPHFKVSQFYNAELNVKTGCEFLKWCVDNAEDNIVVALAYYNAGYGNVSKENVGDSTLNYIHKILGYKNKYDNELSMLVPEVM